MQSPDIGKPVGKSPEKNRKVTNQVPVSSTITTTAKHNFYLAIILKIKHKLGANSLISFC